ncbi:MAG: hypothetical protein HFF81_05150 [Oscillospiraceae bacterium]|nr:hypothetical protein [Oscillospiraceae bacterium]
MEHIKKGAVVLKAAPAAGDMALINRLTLRELMEEEVFTFRVAAADTQVDRDFERFSKECLEKLAELYVGKPFIADHQWSSGNQVARVYAGAVETGEDGVSRLILSCYMLRSGASQTLIDAIEAGINREVSVGVAVKRATCSICGADKARAYCEHRPGKSYDGTLCTVELGDPEDAYEVSFVAVPSQREAGVVKRYAGDQEKPAAPPEDKDAARRKQLTAVIALEKIKFLEEVPTT